MQLQNRVTPMGDIIFSRSRGTMMGNRGNLHTPERKVVRLFKDKAWKICLLEFQGIKREIMGSGSYTELFFLDEATAFAAGHRPCNDCQSERVKEFKRVWLEANSGIYEPMGKNLSDIDRVLHTERIDVGKRKITFNALVSALPDGVFIEMDSKYFLKLNAKLIRWSEGGYTSSVSLPQDQEATVLTPKSIVRCFNSGFIPMIHSTAFDVLNCM